MSRPHELENWALRVGFSFLRGGGGPTTFMSRLRRAFQLMPDLKTTYFFDPRADVLLFANKVRNPMGLPYVLRLDGIPIDVALGSAELDRRNAILKRRMDCASALVIQSNYNRKLIERHLGIPDIPVVVIHNGVCLSEFCPAGPDMRSALGVPKAALVFLASAKWRAHKRLSATLECFARFKNRTKSDPRLIVLGAIDRKPESVPDGVHFLGHIPTQDLPQYYRTADVCIFLSWLDNCPNTIVEALACGVPVLCTNQGGTRELIEMTDGGLVAEVDMSYNGDRVYLYQPPEPDNDILDRSLEEVVDRRTELWASMNREPIGMTFVAHNYSELLRSVI